MSPELFYSILYVMLCVCVIYPPEEFVYVGLTVPNLMSSFLGSRHINFVEYHIKLVVFMLGVYSLLPLGYLLGYYIFISQKFTYVSWNHANVAFQIFTTTAFILPLLALVQIYNWTKDNYKYHPIIQKLQLFSNDSNSGWKTICQDIESECRRIDKIHIKTNAVTEVIATENWIIKVLPLTVHFAHLSDASLVVNDAFSHTLSLYSMEAVQYVNIKVRSRRNGVQPFNIRLNSSDFKDLQDRIVRVIEILPNINFHVSIVDKFVHVFKEAVQENPRYETSEERDNCIGCMQVLANVKLQKQCTAQNYGTATTCSNCYCRPMWCVDCMAKWFASRQNERPTNTWLSSTCTCPICRAPFCILDVCLIGEI